MHFAISDSRKLKRPECGNNSTTRSNKTRGLNVASARSAGSASSAILSKMLGIWSDATGFLRAAAGALPCLNSGALRWSWIMKRLAVSEMGKIWPSKI
ncbi:hypothetical protein IAQ61_001416 [Plenodomus lingam]|uniref:uncharacterized protein n=1 Tax=Leptosphaeria maculans TaxID=5022 RepID=UPI00332B017D|nr:hypothetical protein IAQ61_001416 [Plenodomus lingam]